MRDERAVRDGRPVRSAVAAVLVGLAVAAVAWWRLGPVTRRTVWAEDGGIFLRDRVALGPWDMLHPYAGYLHVLPRLVVDLAWALPVPAYALVVSTTACVLVGGIAALVFVLSRQVLRPWPLRLLLAAVPAVLPLAPVEISGNVANLHWYCMLLAPWLFAHQSRSWWAAGTLAAVTALTVLTEPQTVLFLPLLALAWLPVRRAASGRPDLRALPVTVTALVAGAAQVVTSVSSVRTSEPGSPSWQDLVAGYLLQPFAGAWNARVGTAVEAVLAHGWSVLVVPALVVVGVLAAAVLVGTWRARFLVVALAVGSLVVWVAAIVANGTSERPWAHLSAGMVGDPPLRYAAGAGLLLVSAVALAAGVLVQWGSGVTTDPAQRDRPSSVLLRVVVAAVGWCAVAAVVASSVVSLAPATTRRSAGPEWAPQIPAAARECRGDPRLQVVRVEIAPWGAEVPCGRLR